MTPAKLRELIKRKQQEIEQGDLFALLDVPEHAGAEEIKAAYFKLAKTLHPDRLARAGFDDREGHARDVFRALTNAYNVISNPQSRAAYMGRSKAQREARPVGRDDEEVRVFSYRGDMMLKRRAYQQAEEFLQRAYAAGSTNPKLMVKLGLAIFHNPERSEKERLEEAYKLWERARELSHGEERAAALYHLALYWKARGDLTKVEQSLRGAIRLRENYVEAQRELRLLEMRRQNTPDNSIWARIWRELTKKR